MTRNQYERVLTKS